MNQTFQKKLRRKLKLWLLPAVLCLCLLPGSPARAYDSEFAWSGSYVGTEGWLENNADWYVISAKVDLTNVKTVSIWVNGGLWEAASNPKNWMSASFGVSETGAAAEDFLGGMSSYHKWTSNWANIRQDFTVDVSSLKGEYYLKLHMISYCHDDRNSVLISPSVTLSMYDDAVITKQPVGVSVLEGQTAAFDAAADNASGCVWQRQAADGSWQELPEGGKYRGTRTTELRLTAETGDDGAVFRCVFAGKNGGGSTATEGAVLRVLPKSISGIRVKYPFNKREIGETIQAGQMVAILQYDNGAMDFAMDFQGFSFLTDGAASDSYVVKAGENTVTVCLNEGGRQFTDSFKVTGVDTVPPRIERLAAAGAEGGEIMLRRPEDAPAQILVSVEAADSCGLHPEGAYYFAPRDAGFSYEQVTADSGWQTQAQALVEIAENGEYSAYVRDAFGNVAEGHIMVTAFDLQEPWLELTVDPQEGSWAREFTLTAKGSDDNGLAEQPYRFGGETESGRKLDGSYGVSDSLTVSENGIYEVFVQDAAGHESSRSLTIRQIDREAPRVETAGFTETPVDGIVYLLVKASDEKSGLSALWYEKQGGREKVLLREYEDTWQVRETVEIKENGCYIFRAVDAVGNVQEAQVEITSLPEDGRDDENGSGGNNGNNGNGGGDGITDGGASGGNGGNGGANGGGTNGGQGNGITEETGRTTVEVQESVVISGLTEQEILERMAQEKKTLMEELLKQEEMGTDGNLDALWDISDWGQVSEEQSGAVFVLPEQKSEGQQNEAQTGRIAPEEPAVQGRPSENAGGWNQICAKLLKLGLLLAPLFALLLWMLLPGSMTLYLYKKKDRKSFPVCRMLYRKKDGKFYVLLPPVRTGKGKGFRIVFSKRFAEHNLPLQLVLIGKNGRVQYFCETKQVDITEILCHIKD